MKTVKFYTLGCKVNQYESEALRGQLFNAGFSEAEGNIADLYIINTCTVTHRADSDARRLVRKAIKDNPKAQIVVTGCYVEKDALSILEISDKIKILPNQLKHRIVEILNNTIHHSPFTIHDTFTPLNISNFHNHQRAFVKIQDGCNNFCAYCKVPLVRGRSRSRNLKQIKEELSRLIRAGFKEIVLTGICLGDYRYKDFDLADVVSFLEKVEGKFRIRLSSIEPQLVNAKLIEKIATSDKVCPHLHIPLQSGDDAILRKMNRQYTQKEYLSLIARIKKKIKNVAITTDILAGFPGEAEKNFRNTISCLKKVLPLRTHIFSFSPRRGTAAFELIPRIEPQIVKERVSLLKEVAAECSYKYRRRFLKKELNVLIESQGNKEASFLSGYSENYIRVMVEGADKKDINNLVKVKIKKVDNEHTYAELMDK